MSNAPLTASCDFQFKLFDALQDGNQVGQTLPLTNVPVRNGLFNVELDFGRGVFFGDRYLEVSVAYPSGSGTFSTLSPRQKLLPTPLALFAAGVADGAVTSAGLAAGAVVTNKIADGAVTDVKIAGVSWAKITGTPLSLPPSGPAGGALTGNYPNPDLAANAVTGPAIAAGAVTNAKINDVAYAKITGAPATLPPSGAAGGDLTGTYPNPVLGNLVVNNAKIADVAYAKITGAPATLPPSGAAGGSLAGTYPNPTLANNVVTSLTIKDRNVIGTKLADSAVTSRTIAAGAVTSISLANNAVTDAKVRDVAYSKITGAPASLPPTGVAGGDLTGSYPNPTITANAVTNAKIANLAVTNAKINDVAYAKITGAPATLPPSGAAGGSLSGTYPNPAIANNAVTSVTIAPGAVNDTKIANVAYGKLTGAPTSLPPTGAAGGSLAGTYPNPTIATNAVTSVTIAANAIVSAKIAAGAVTSISLANNAVTDAKVRDVAYSKVTGAPASLPPTGVAGGDLAGSYPNPTITANAVTNAKIANLAVTNAKINDVAYAKITGAPATLPPSGAAGGSLTGTYPNPTIATNAVTSVTIAANAIVSAKIAAGAVTSISLANNAVTDAKVRDVAYSKITGAPSTLPPTGTAGGDLAGSYPNPTIANLAVTNAKINDVAYAKITGAPATLPPSGAAGGSLTGTYPNPTIAANAVSSATIAANAVVTAKIADGAVTSRTIAAGAVTSISLANNAVTDANVRDVAYSKITGAPSTLPPTGTAGGDLAGSYPNPTIANLAVTNAKINDVAYAKITGAPTTLPPSGAAGGSLTGTYPNPTIANNAVTSITIAPGAVSDVKIANVAYGKITGAPATLPPSGAAGGSLTGTYPNPTIAANAVSSATIAANAVVTAKIADGAVTSRTIAAGAVTSISLANNAVTDAKVRDVAYSKITGAPSTLPPTGTAGGDLAGSYPNPTIANLAVTNAKINDVAYAKITGAPATLPPSGAAGGSLAGTYPNPTIATNAVTSITIAPGAVSDVKIANVAYGKITGAPTSLPPSGAAGGSLTGSYPNPTLAVNSVTTPTIADHSVNAAKLSVPLVLTGFSSSITSAVLTITDMGLGRAIDAITYSDRSGVRGQSFGLNGFGVYGIATNGASAMGIGGESPLGFGAVGTNTSTGNFGRMGTTTEGVYGFAGLANLSGVTGYASLGTSASGVTGLSDAGSGVFGLNQVSGNYGNLGGVDYGVLGTATTGYAGRFKGDVLVNGNFNCSGSKNFMIDHPLDPEHKYLVHSSIEGPERMTIYNGNVVTDAKGQAVVKLPNYFEALNKDYRYQLTVIGVFAQAIISEEIKNNSFKIKTDRPNVKVSWQVMGTRQDAFAREHPFVTEVPKAAESGTK